MTRLDDREFVARLILSVLAERITVREALMHYPKNTTDKNLMAACKRKRTSEKHYKKL